MEGIAYVTDDRGRRTAVLIDLTTWGDSWEDIEDFLVSRSRKDEPTLAWADVKRALENEAEPFS